MSKPLLVVVGAGAGVSASVAKKFGSEGFKIALIARRTASLAALAEELTGQGIEAFAVEADATVPAAVEEAFARIRASFGEPSALLYNAAAITRSTVSSLDEQQLIDDFKVNVVGALTSVKQVVPSFVERKQGTILVTGGGLAISPNPAYASLSIGKAGVRSLVYSLAEELAPQGVYVGTVTIGGYVSKGTFYDPDRIAESYWQLHVKRDQAEIIFAEN
ncbi:short chain dehydrogenase [Cohnella sp. OV330]|uniref:SDR family NAD(P)-dependent oxidoreductase n=1 Tax=Cohnella sp. OV330 TaxID=1855288 RepID=UPI0008EC3B99|nr:SDR family NAD(P)-dependent oxidoreductase [Cohnella sp. OV330]SFB59047.1 short chain dehydrogenase [Cohnella sp. OV330]